MNNLIIITVFLICFFVVATKGEFEYSSFDSYSVGGVPVNISDFPYQVSIHYSFYGHVCGGAIISPTWILTAARCVDKFDHNKLSIIVGKTALDDETVENLPVLKVIVHENFDGSPLPEFDIALLEVNELTFGDEVQSIDLPDQDSKLPTDPNKRCDFTGWGAREMGGDIPWDLQQVDQFLLNFNVCNVAVIAGAGFELPDTTICATNDRFFQFESGGPCSGEWGSPLVCDEFLLGLLSGDPLTCGRAALPNFYTKVSAFRTWVDQNINKKNID